MIRRRYVYIYVREFFYFLNVFEKVGKDVGSNIEWVSRKDKTPFNSGKGSVSIFTAMFIYVIHIF